MDKVLSKKVKLMSLNFLMHNWFKLNKDVHQSILLTKKIFLKNTKNQLKTPVGFLKYFLKTYFCLSPAQRTSVPNYKFYPIL